MRLSTLALVSSVCIVSGTALALQKKHGPLAVVGDVDLNRYQGKWYEIARLPARFERQCASDVSAEYTLRDDGRVQVVNRCRRKDGQWTVAKGVARLRDADGPTSKLRVQFFWPFNGDYWILDLDAEYQWALVGTPDRKYLWILSRTAALQDATYEGILGKARGLGFDVDAVIRSAQSGD